ncbi:hypothetical protein MBLNU230_g4928t1 [Neophaeotheca triangularis]
MSIAVTHAQAQAQAQAQAPFKHSTAASRPKTVRRQHVAGPEAAAAAAAASTSTQVAHTLTACTRCRARKTRCDPGLPRCNPCERTNSVCEYFDSNKGGNVNRNYVVYLQHRLRDLEEELARVEGDDSTEDEEAMMRSAAVRMQDAKETKFLGPSSGIAITRLVMQLAKQFNDAKSIKDIVSEDKAQQIKELYNQEQAKPTSKVYPLTSDVAADQLPNRALGGMLLHLYRLKVQPMYPALHEPTLDKDFEAAYTNCPAATAYQNFVCRMVIAISLQKMDTQYAGLADSYYLAALTFFQEVVKPMNLQTLQCFALMAEYSLLTPTRTAIYYIVGLAVRLLQALGYNEEKTLSKPGPDGRIDVLEVDMRRRIFWCILVMECGLSHSLGRPCILATNQDHIDVGWFETCDDKYITPEGIDPAAHRPLLSKWVSIHFFKMRLLQLEIRRKLYQKKRPEPKNDQHEWFIQMQAKLSAWVDASPNQDEGSGIDKRWFIGRYNTMVVFLYRPSPQVPRPSLDAALKCYDACEYNIYMQREQITKRNVDLTWIFTQSIFMAINTMLWSLSYEEVRRRHSKDEVGKHLDVAMDAIQLASERWPGVASAVQLYHNLINAVMKIYEKDGDVPISAASPSDQATSPAQVFSDGTNRSRGTSPATVASSPIATPPETRYGYVQRGSRGSVEQPPPEPYQSNTPPHQAQSSYQQQQQQQQTMQAMQNAQEPLSNPYQQYQQQFVNFDPSSSLNPLPQFTPELTMPGWNPAFASHQPPSYHTYSLTNNAPSYPQPYQPYPLPQSQPQPHSSTFDPTPYPYPDPLIPTNPSQPQTQDNMPSLDQQFLPLPQLWGPSDTPDTAMFNDAPGLNQSQHEELMLALENEGMEDIQTLITGAVDAMAAATGKTGAVLGQGSQGSQVDSGGRAY